MEFSGKVIAVLPVKSGTSKVGNPWMVQEYVVESNEMYPKKMCFDVFGEDKIKQFDIKMGEELTVSFDIDAREWQGRWFNSIRAWKVERGAAMPGQPLPPPAPTEAPDFLQGDNNDDLPF
ncbi:hypothetical protein Bcop_0974 [Bacteroides coprosuis DSM 18011]|uniref:DUF3127 domain-containing protein n=1 Tax=Bacteroides coprosuis DSM 18011 TaxID=679937 RepID=F3ZUL6_9BACE|nr:MULTISPECIES: DUF3127 domain-containing protein [Bacteroides]EGJ71181.1 hypothetical protein Bcop_0974 [Bacteroides coprosuis DSM 18011]HJD91534.1 DUF3127 domain-containing protein [Bacteroides coprosuis]